MIIGINATKSAVVIAETRGKGGKFAITAIRPVTFQVRSGEDLAELLRCLITLFDRGIRIPLVGPQSVVERKSFEFGQLSLEIARQKITQGGRGVKTRDSSRAVQRMAEISKPGMTVFRKKWL